MNEMYGIMGERERDTKKEEKKESSKL